MVLEPEKAGRPNAVSDGARPAGGAMVYANVAVDVPWKLNEKVPTCVRPSLRPSGWPRVTYTGPVIDVGVVQTPPGITSHNGLKRPGADASGRRGSYVYHTAKTWFVPECWVKLTPQPGSLSAGALYHMSV